MIEDGIPRLVNANLSSPPNVFGGFKTALPKDAPLPNWFYRVLHDQSQNTLNSFKGLSKMILRIECVGNNGNEAVVLARGIDRVLNGFRGNLPDPDVTYIDSCFSDDMNDPDEDTASRSYRRVIDFEIWYASK